MPKKSSSRAVECLERNKPALLAVLARYGVENPRLFGSVARGEETDDSDIDIVVSKTAPMGYATKSRLREEVTSAVGWPVDLVFETALKPEVEAEIRSDMRPLL